MATEREGSVVKLTVFSGKRADYKDWWRTFKTFAAVHKFTVALSVQARMPATAATALSTVDATRKLQEEAIRKNDLAMSQLNLALVSDADKGLIYKSGATSGWPDGLASNVVTLLDRRYNARDTTSLLELKQELNDIRMKDDEEPSAMFGRMMRIKNRYDAPGDTISDRDLMSAALRAAPTQYQAVLTAIRVAAANNLTSDMIEDAMMSHYRLVAGSDACKTSNKRGGKNANGEYQLAAVATRKNKNACWDCGNMGHRLGDAECPSKGKGLNKPNSNRNQGARTDGGKGKTACATCGKIHKGPCWEDARNAHLRPANWKSGKAGGTEVNAAAIGHNEFLLCGLCLEQKNEDADVTEYILAALTFPKQMDLLNGPNVFIADTGSSCHSTKYDLGFSNLRKADKNHTVTMANDAKELSTKVGDLKGIICNKEGQEVSEATMVDVTFLPGGHFNLFSCSRLTQEGWTMHGDKECIKMTKGNATICFDIVIPTAKGAIYAMYFKRAEEVATVVTDASAVAVVPVPMRSNKMTIMQAHNRLGHANEDAIRKAAKAMGITITPGAMGPCEGCSVAKAKQKNVPKHNATHVKSVVFPERIFIDITFLKPTEDEPKLTKPNMLIVVDEATGLKMVFFYDHKDHMIEPLCQLINKWKQNNKIVLHVRMDNAGENLAFIKRSENAVWKLNLKFEITARDTPQQNHLAELGIAVLMNKA